MSGTLLSLGHGYSAAALARRLLPEGWRVLATTRDAARAGRLAETGVEPLSWPLADPAAALAEADAVLTSIPPGPEGDPALAALGPALDGARLRWVGYLSTTGVYGDSGGAWVDEDSPLKPSSPRSAARVAAEAAWRALWRERGLPVHVFRLAGIYGPGRSPFERIRAGTARRIVKPGQVFSRIHVDDIAAVLAASLAAPEPGAVYNVCDDEAAPPQDVIAHAAALIDASPPPEIAWEDAAPGMSTMARSFYGDCRRVSNRRIREGLGVALAYPTYREGLAATLAAEQGDA
jgi:nucleoside-diphosphate-sugar epimerase